jgi:hypothetical protein
VTVVLQPTDMSDKKPQFDPMEAAAIRKTIDKLAGERADIVDDGPLDCADAAAERLNDLEERLAELERVVDPDPGSADYDGMTRAQRTHRVRVHLLTVARNSNVTTMNYRDVKNLFDGHPSTGYAYTLMEQAAEIDGFVYETGGHGDGEKRIRVKQDDVNDERVVHAVNNGGEETRA